MAPIIRLVLFGFVTIAHASPLNIFLRQHTDDRLAYIKRTFPGIYWDEASLKCSGDDFNILQEATRMLAPFTDVDEDRFDETAAWNRFFVTDKKAKKGQGWHVSYYALADDSSSVTVDISIACLGPHLILCPGRHRVNSG